MWVYVCVAMLSVRSVRALDVLLFGVLLMVGYMAGGSKNGWCDRLLFLLHTRFSAVLLLFQVAVLIPSVHFFFLAIPRNPSRNLGLW